MCEFEKFHPVVNLLYFISVILFSMIFMHPVCIGISVVCFVLYSIYLGGANALKFNMFFMVPMLIVAIMMNVLFNHEGVTIIAYFPDGNPFTMESLIYGIASAFLLVSVVAVFSVINKIMTTDKLLCVFGRITPSLSLIMSMTLRFVPRFITHIKSVYQANSDEDLKLFDKLKLAVKSFYATVGWAMENSIETADSMRARGYGLCRRTAYSNFKLGKRDTFLLCLIMGLDVAIVLLKVFAKVSWQYFPKIEFGEIEGFELLFFCVYLALFLLPFIIEVWEVFRWKLLRSKI